MNAKQAREIMAASVAHEPTAGAFQEAIADRYSNSARQEFEVYVRGEHGLGISQGHLKAPDAPRGVKFSPAAFAEPIASALKAFHALAPIAEVRFAPKGRWTLILQRPLPWPLFLRCDVSAVFAPRAAWLTLILRDAPVTALEFDGEALCVWCAE